MIPAAPVAAPADGTVTRPASRRLDAGEVASRALIAGLFLALTIRIGTNFLETGRVTGLLLVISELLVVILTVLRRPARAVDRSLRARIFTGGSILGPLVLQPAPAGGLLPDTVTATVSATGLAVIIAGKVALGRSFGLMPAHRGLVRSGPYLVVRHPIYLGYLVTHAAFLTAHPGWWNLSALVVADAGLVVRAVYEERTLTRDPDYAAYQRQVRWRLVPGLF
jgi:hypothetical protein